MADAQDDSDDDEEEECVLHEDVIMKIFSFLPYSKLFSQCVLLSRRWRSILQSRGFHNMRWNNPRSPESWESRNAKLLDYRLRSNVLYFEEEEGERGNKRKTLRIREKNS